MKGYTESRGHAFKLGFDAESGQFIEVPIAHAIEHGTKQNAVSQKLAEMRKHRQERKANHQLSELLVNMSPDIRDDIGMTEVFPAEFAG